MRILLLTDSMDIGGAETHVCTLARVLTEAGETVEVASVGGRLVAALTAHGILHHTLPTRKHPFALVRALRRLFLHSYTIVHAHTRMTAFLAMLFCPRHTRIVTTCHAAYPPSLYDKLPVWGAHTFAVSADLCLALRARGLSPLTTSVLVNAVFSENVPRQPVPHCIVAVHRMDADTVLPARLLCNILPRLRAHYPDAKLLLVGDGTEMDNLRAVAGDGVTLVGAVTDPTPYYQMADVVIGISRSALEAMALGVPVILAGTPGYMGMVTPENFPQAAGINFTCRGCENLTEDRLYHAILNLFSMSTDAKEEVAHTLQKRVRAQYSPQEMASHTLAVYRRLARPTRPLKRLYVGYFGCENLGDDAMLTAELQADSKPAAVVAAHPQRARRLYGVPTIGKYRLLSLCLAMSRAEEVVFGGGSLLQNTTSWRSLLYYAALFWLAGFCRARRILYANGLGPCHGAFAHRVVRTMLQNADAVSLRDGASIAFARSLGVTRAISLVPDPALSLSPVLPPIAPLPADMVLVALRHHVPPQFVAELESLAADGVRFAFLVMQPRDLPVTRAVALRTDGMLLPPLSAAEVRGLLAASAVRVVTMRYHLALFATACGRRWLGIGDDPKLVAAAVSAFAPPPCLPTDCTAQLTAFLAKN